MYFAELRRSKSNISLNAVTELTRKLNSDCIVVVVVTWEPVVSLEILHSPEYQAYLKSPRQDQKDLKRNCVRIGIERDPARSMTEQLLCDLYIRPVLSQ